MVRGDRLKLREVARKFATVAALLALLLPGVSALAETLSATELPACCNTVYCPLHHRQKQSLEQDKSNCDSTRGRGNDGCSMRACDAPSRPVVGNSAFLLASPVALRGPAFAETAAAIAFEFSLHIPAIPLTPPPRTFPS
jgi:hypothetical protein